MNPNTNPSPDPNGQLPQPPEIADQNAVQAPATQPSSPPSPVVSTVGPAEVSVPVKNKSKVGLIIGLIVALLLLLGISFAAYSLFFSDAAQTKKAANDFMEAITSGNKEEVFLIAEADDSNKPFLSTATDNVSGDTYQLESSTEGDTEWNYMYDLSGGNYKTARVTVEKQDGVWKVSGFVYGGSTDSESSQQTATEPVVANNCMVSDDFKVLGGAYESTQPPYAGKLLLLENFFFKADQAEYEFSTEQNNNQINEYIQFANTNAGKDFSVVIAGSINTGGAATVSASDQALAEARAQRVKNDLISKGFPADKLTIGEPEIFTEYTGEHRRNVNVTVIGTPCGADSSNSNR